MADSSNNDNKKNSGKAVQVTPSGKPRIGALAGLGAFKGTANFNKIMEQKKSEHNVASVSKKPVIIKQVAPTPEPAAVEIPVIPETKIEAVAAPATFIPSEVPVIEAVEPSQPIIKEELKVVPASVKTSTAVKAATIANVLVEKIKTESIKFQPPQKEGLNTSKVAPVAKIEGFQTPQNKVLNTSQPPHQTPQNKVFDQPVKRALNNLSNQSVSKHKFRGNTLAIIRFLFDEILKNGGTDTGRVTMPYIAEGCGVPRKSTEKLLSQLTKEGVLNVVEMRVGNGGYRVLSLDPSTFTYMVNFNQNLTPYQTPHFGPSKEVSKFNNNITNYSQPNLEGLQSKNFNFKDLDFTEVAPLHWTQVNSSIRKQVEEKFEKEEMQLFVDKFMVWMSTQKNVQSVIGLFCAKIKEYLEEGDSPVMQCLSKKELEAEKEFRQKAEQLAQQQAMVNKFNQEVASKAIDEKFEAWLGALSDDQKLQFVPESNYAKLGSGAHNGALKAYFIEKFPNQEL